MTWFGRNGVSPEADYLYRKAREKVDAEDYQNAVTVLNQAVEISPHFPQAFVELGNCYDCLNRGDEAISSYDKAIQIDPLHADTWFNKGMCLKKMGREKEALQCVEKAIDLYCGR